MRISLTFKGHIITFLKVSFVWICCSMALDGYSNCYKITAPHVHSKVCVRINSILTEKDQDA